MSKAERMETDIVFDIVYGAMAVGVIIWGVAQFIDACRSRQKVKGLAFGFKKPDESSSAKESPG